MAKTTRYLDEGELEQVFRLAKVGLTHEQIANYFGMSRDWIQKRLKDHPELKSTIEKGRSTAIFEVGSSLYQQAIKGNVAAMIFYLKTQAGWSETDVDTRGEQEPYKSPRSLTRVA